jgi:hypothetical protein
MAAGSSSQGVAIMTKHRWRRTAVGFEREGAVVFQPIPWAGLWANWRCDWAAIDTLGRLVCGMRSAFLATVAIRQAKTAASWARRRR